MSLSHFSDLLLLGKGSFGRVYRATRLSDGVEYAIKELDVAHMTPKEREESINEVRLLASISHPNVLKFCEAFIQSDQLYIVTELAAQDLDSRLAAKRRTGSWLREETVWAYFIQIVLGLRALHASSVLHRDLKPQNLFLMDDHQVKIGDLGCSKVLKRRRDGEDMAATMEKGTPYFISPEQWKGRKYDKKSDVWALGCCLYSMTMMQPLYDGKNMRDLAKRVCTLPVPRIRVAMNGDRSDIPSYSSELSALCAVLLQKEPERRPTCDDILAMPCVSDGLHSYSLLI